MFHAAEAAAAGAGEGGGAGGLLASRAAAAATFRFAMAANDIPDFSTAAPMAAVAKAKRLALPFYLAVRLALYGLRWGGVLLKRAHKHILDERYLRGVELQNIEEP
jgi:hypothetical protein